MYLSDIINESDLSSSAKLVAYVIGSYVDNETGKATPPIRDLADNCSLSTATIQRAIAELVEKKILHVGKERKRQRTVNAYWFHVSVHVSVDVSMTDTHTVSDDVSVDVSMTDTHPSESVFQTGMHNIEKCVDEKVIHKERKKVTKKERNTTYVTYNARASEGSNSSPDENKIYAEIAGKVQGLINSAVPINMQPIRGWLKSGADEQLILETIGVVMAKRRERGEEDPPTSLNYFEAVIKKAIKQANQPLEIKDETHSRNISKQYGRKSQTEQLAEGAKRAFDKYFAETV